MSEHTPGDWIVDDSGNVSGAKGRLVANCGGWQNSRMTCREENMANARLVTAAPDLFAVCEAMLTHLTAFTRNYRTREECDMLNQARAALDKPKPPKADGHSPQLGVVKR